MLRVWATTRQVPVDSAVGRQVAAMQSLAEDACTGTEFAVAWLAARRESLEAGERTRDPLDRALLDVFYAVEEYPIDPTLREPGDTTDSELKTVVVAALALADAATAPDRD